LDRFGIGGIGLDVAADLAGEVVNRSGDATSNQVSLDLTEPQLDLIELRRVGWREVEVYPAVVLKKVVDQSGVVRREVVEDDVSLLAGTEPKPLMKRCPSDPETVHRLVRRRPGVRAGLDAPPWRLQPVLASLPFAKSPYAPNG
jgi:hypothetical protein